MNQRRRPLKYISRAETAKNGTKLEKVSVRVVRDYYDLRSCVARALYGQRTAHLLDSLAHADKTETIMVVGLDESFTIIFELQPKLRLVEVEARFEPAGAGILQCIR
jgi:hypothetical protein